MFDTQGGICLMGGASENDEAMAWFLEGAGDDGVVGISDILGVLSRFGDTC